MKKSRVIKHAIALFLLLSIFCGLVLSLLFHGFLTILAYSTLPSNLNGRGIEKPADVITETVSCVMLYLMHH